MLVLGLAGGSGSGKGTVAAIFKKYNISSIDTDAIYRKMTGPGGVCIEPLVKEFGKDILLADGSIDRKKLAGIVFSPGGESKKEKLQKITHFHILNEVRKKISEAEERREFAILVDAPLLFESGFDRECNEIIAVVADKNSRIERIIKRDGISYDAAVARIESQLSDEFLINRSNYVIVNNSTVDELENSVRAVAEKIKKR